MREGVYIIKASAGSGKTRALARQYVDILLESPPQNFLLREILAITFTNKAALEMKERILETLKMAALSGSMEAFILMGQIIRNYHLFQVQTIDSFIKAVLSGCIFKMDFSSGFKIKKDYRENLGYSLDILIDKAVKDRKMRSIFINFLRQYLYVENRASWFIKRDILSLIEGMTYFYNVYGSKFIKNNIKSADIIVKKKTVLKLMRKLRKNIPDGTNQRFLKSFMLFLDKIEENFDIDSIPAFFDRARFPINKGYDIPEGVKNLWEAIRKNLREACEMESVSLGNLYIDIFEKIADIFKEISSEDDLLFLEELNRYAGEVLDGNSMTVGEIYYRIATRLRHYLIDEFQDTSLLQWRNLVQMIEEALSTGGTFFCVGDRKQAIYRFRGGDPFLLEYVEQKFKDYNIIYKNLNTNFRSQKEIVIFNNKIFSAENIRRFIREREDFIPEHIEDIIKGFKDSQQSYLQENGSGYIRIEVIESPERAERESIIREKVIELIGELHRRFSYDEIGILTRDNDTLKLVTAWLLEKGIPVESSNTLNIKEESHIKEVISFLKFLNSPIDNLAFAGFILGDIFTRASGLSRERIRRFLFEMGKGDKRDIYFYTEFRRQYPDIWNKLIDTFFRRSGFVPLYELIIDFFSKFNVIELFPQYQGFFMRFLELIKEQEETNADISLFLDFWDRAGEDELYVEIKDANYVKVFTIHRAKGLEFPVVIVPFLDIEIKVGMGNRFRNSFTIYPGDDGLHIQRLKKRYGSFSPYLNVAYMEEYKKSFIDELNNIYVAFTRAKNELYIFIPRKGDTPSKAESLLQVKGSRTEMGVQVDYRKTKSQEGVSKADCNSVRISLPHYRDWTALLGDEFIELARIKNRKEVLRGDILHYLLSLIGNIRDSSEAVRYAIGKTLLHFPSIGNLKNFESILKEMLENKALRPFFFIGDGVVYQEKEIVDRAGKTYRIDRLIVKSRDVWVIDYKSSRDNMENYKVQMYRYMECVRDLYPEKYIKGFLIFLDDFSVEEIQWGLL